MAFDSVNKKCVVCKKGNTLLRDKICAPIQAPKCQDANYNAYAAFAVDGDLGYHLFANPKGPGCNQCDGWVCEADETVTVEVTL